MLTLPKVQRTAAIPIHPAAAIAPAPALTCHGCQHCWYSAPGGQKGSDYRGRPAILDLPHSRCTKLNAYVPMVLGDHGKWLASEVPLECPIHRQPELFPC